MPLRALGTLFSTLALLAGTTPAQADDPLVVMVEDAAAPWSQADGSGAANDIVRAAFAAAGVPIALRTVAYARCKYEVATGTAAACFSMSADPALVGKVVMSKHPLFRSTPQYFHNPQHPLRASDETQLPAGAVIGIVSGYEYPPAVTALAQRGVVLEPIASEKANLKKLASGRIDAAIVNLDELKSARFLLRDADVEGRVAPLFRSADLDAYIGFSEKNPRGQWARARFDEGFAAIERNGTLRRILQQWRARMQR